VVCRFILAKPLICRKCHKNIKIGKDDFIFIRKETELALVDAAHDGVERRNCYMNSMGALHGIAYF